jgi:hypothetical protein
MKTVMRGLVFLAVLAFLILGGSIFVSNYSIIFSRRVIGQIVEVKQIDTNIALMQVQSPSNDKINPQLYSSYAVAIKEKTGEIVTASAEDRQWAVAKPGNCAEAVYYPYPPWRFEKANTYFGARLEKLTDCQTPPAQ